jgi:hypothetical protein
VENGGTLAIPADAETELAYDHVAHKVVVLKEPQGAVGVGRYLVDDAGVIRWKANDVPKFDAPKAQLFRLIIDGTLGGKLPWGLVLIGVLLAILMELVGVAALPFAVGLYLPVSTSAGIFVGGAVRYLVDKKRKARGVSESEFSPGMLMASGLIAGGAITGVLLSVIETIPGAKSKLDLSGALPLSHIETWWPMLPFLAMAFGLYYVGTRSKE